MNIVLHQPEIAGNTGNIGRTCAATGTGLHLIEPLGFKLTRREIKRAGMDYWHELELYRHMNYDAFLAWYQEYCASRNDIAEPRPCAHAAGVFAPEAAPQVAPQPARAPQIWYATTKAERLYTEANFGPDDFIMFGKESAGIPEEILVENHDHCIRIPMGAQIRSLNLANSVAIVLYEALRQQDFAGLESQGHLHRLHWKEE